MCDWDKYGASSSLLILDWIPDRNKFKVVRRVEVPKAEYSFDAAVNLIIQLNKIYNPSFIYCDAGSGEYQIESLHKYGDEHKETGLKNKVKRFQFSQKIDVMDPIKKTIEAKPMKPFMVNQLTMAIEREQLILSPFDELLHKQLVDYEVIRMSANGNPVFTDVNEHFVDALGLAFLAFALEFPEITRTIDRPTFKADAVVSESPLKERALKSLETITKGFAAIGNPWEGLKNGSVSYEDSQDPRDADQPKLFPVSVGWMKAKLSGKGSGWGSRSSGSFGRSMF